MRRYMHIPLIEFEYNNKIINKSTDTRIYRDATLINPGIFSDSLSNRQLMYKNDILKEYANNWKDNYINLDHSHETLKRIGIVENTRYEDEKVKGDLYIYPITRYAEDTINLIDKGLINWLSVELLSNDKWDSDEDMWYVDNIEFIGLAVCTIPAVQSAKIKEDGPSPADVYYNK